jgi:hypothetical protein
MTPPDDYVEKGLSNGPGMPDYEGVVFSDGRVTVRWLTIVGSTSNFDNLEHFMIIHGHPEYNTQLRWAKVNDFDTPDDAQR